MAAIHHRMPDAWLVVAGVGDGLPRLQAYAEEQGIVERVLWPGWVNPERAHTYLAAADAIVTPYRDTLINRAKCAGKVVAAMAMGKAVVTSRIGENLSYIEHGRSGLLTEPGDAQDLAQGLMRVLEDRCWASELGRRARQRIWERFDWDLRVGEVERIYELARAQAADILALSPSQPAACRGWLGRPGCKLWVSHFPLRSACHSLDAGLG